MKMQKIDNIIQYLQSDKCRKKKGLDNISHQKSIDELICYLEMLEGGIGNLTEDEKKQIHLTSYPIQWNNSWIQTG